MKQIWIKGTKEEVKEIMNRVIKQHKNITIVDYLNKYGKEKQILG